MTGINVLSLFDGMSCGQIALERAGIKVDNYFASEIKKHAIKVTQHNFTNTIQLGDITGIRIGGGQITCQNGVFNCGKIDLVIGGSPCQDFSRANSIRDGLSGEKSGLFFEYLRILNEAKPTYFLLENVIMSDADYMIISDYVGTEPVRINSALVSAQLRDRLYWTNIGDAYFDLFGNRKCAIPTPKNKGIKASDIIVDGHVDRDKFLCLMSRSGERWGNLFNDDRYLRDYNQTALKKRYAKAFDNVVFLENGVVRPLYSIEMERLQTVPDGYTDILRNWTYQANLLGDGWTVDVIAHILKFMR